VREPAGVDEDSALSLKTGVPLMLKSGLTALPQTAVAVQFDVLEVT
jgi:hypothetical protein